MSNTDNPIDKNKIDSDSPILVTGANGYIASWIIKYLLEAGHTVHGTVRNPSDRKKVGHLQAIAADAPGELKLFKADLLDKSAFDAPMAGCQLVMHTASPFVVQNLKDPEKELVQPALLGTEAVLEACNRVDSVKRVVLTSSVAAIYGDSKDMQDLGLDEYTEKQWNTTSSVDHQPYSYSKTVAEKRAWEIAKSQQRWDLLTINPSLVAGPSLTSASISGSLQLLKQIANGDLRTGAPDLRMGIVDVRDVAQAHIKAGFTTTASGRHICNSASASILDIAATWKAEFGNHWPFPLMQAPKPLVWLMAPTAGIDRKFVSRNVGYDVSFNNSYTEQDLGIKFRPVNDTLNEHFQQMLTDGVIKDRRG